MENPDGMTIGQLKSFLSLKERSTVGVKAVLVERVKGLLRERELKLSMDSTGALTKRILELMPKPSLVPAMPSLPDVLGINSDLTNRSKGRKRKGTVVDHVKG